MKKTSIKLLALALAVSLCSCASTVPIVDVDAQNKHESMSIVATSTAICKILDSLNYDNVIGVPETETVLPAEYADLATIGSPMSPDYEIIKSLSPDLVLSPGSLEKTLAADFTAAQINSAFFDLSSVEGMYKAITSLGNLLDRSAEAKKLVQEYEEYMAEYKTKDNNTPSVLLLMTFPDGFYLVSTEDSYVGNLVEIAGGKNVYGDEYSGDENGFASINPEDIAQKQPDIILVFAHYSEDTAFEYMKNEFNTNSMWQHFEAVEKNKVHYLPSKYFGMSATLEWKEALELLKPILYEE